MEASESLSCENNNISLFSALPESSNMYSNKDSNLISKLDFDSTKTIIQVLIMSKLDYCNALLPGSSKLLLTKLQCIQNMACRIVCSLRKFDHVTQPM